MEENELWCINWMLEIEFEVLFGWYECVPKEICTLFWAPFLFYNCRWRPFMSLSLRARKRSWPWQVIVITRRSWRTWWSIFILKEMQSTKATPSCKREWNFGMWRYTSTVWKEFAQRRWGSTFSSHVYHKQLSDVVPETVMEAIRQIGEILEARLRYTQEYLREVHAEMMEMKLKATTMKQKIEDFKAHVAQFQWDWRILKEEKWIK